MLDGRLEWFAAAVSLSGHRSTAKPIYPEAIERAERIRWQVELLFKTGGVPACPSSSVRSGVEASGAPARVPRTSG